MIARITYLLHLDSQWLEIGACAAEEMCQDVGGCPSAGVRYRLFFGQWADGIIDSLETSN